MGYRSGKAGIEEAIAIAEASRGESFNVTHPIQNPYNISWKDGDVKTVRFLTDGAITIPFHNFIRTKGEKNRDFVDTSELEGVLKRPDWIAANFSNDKGRPLRPTNQTISMVVERVLDPKTKEWVDKTREFEILSDPDDPESEKVTVEWPAFWILKQGMRFWKQVDAYWGDPDYNFTTTDRNWKVTRSGKTAQDTGYTVAPTLKSDGKTAQDHAADYGVPVLEGYEDDPVQGWIVKWIERRGTDKWFSALEGYVPVGGSEEGEEPAVETEKKSRPVQGVRKPKEVVSDEETSNGSTKTASLKDRLSQYK